MKKEMIMYQADSGAIEFKGDFKKETIWASQAQIAELFLVERSVITKHIRNIFRDKELEADSVCAIFAHTAEDGKTYQVTYYNLDLIISVGYRVNSKKATVFRQWATKTLRSHIVDGYTINKKRLAKNYDAFLHAVEDVKALLPSGGQVQAQDALELVKMFASTWFSLDAYDKATLPKRGAQKKQIVITATELADALVELKRDLVKKKEATPIFGQERSKGSLEGIVGNVFQSFSGNDLYPTLEEKAAHLLYFVVKNHPFTDGNKRSGAFSFVWFLRRASILNPARMSAEALTALTLLVAESKPKEKEKMVGLILLLLSKK
jgi:prophage maintenance system killer protein